MQHDIFGKKRYRVNLHTHTNLSDGAKSPEEVIAIYRAKGYDAIALTDHWHYGEEYVSNSGMLVLSGAEYNIFGKSSAEGLFHIVGVGMKYDPMLEKTASAQDAINAVKAAGGLAIIAHPAWSLNTPEHILPLENADATEIYNTVSGMHMSRRADASLIVDMLGAKGRFYPLVADDDTHYYDGDECFAWIMVEAEELTSDSLTEAIRQGRFYATQGPEVHAFKDGDDIVVRCSKAVEIVFFSDNVWSRRVFTGDHLTEARYTPNTNDSYIRVEITDKNGKRAWTNCIKVK